MGPPPIIGILSHRHVMTDSKIIKVYCQLEVYKFALAIIIMVLQCISTLPTSLNKKIKNKKKPFLQVEKNTNLVGIFDKRNARNNNFM